MPKALIYILAGGAVLIGGIVVYNMTTKPAVATTTNPAHDETASDWAKGLGAFSSLFDDVVGLFSSNNTTERNDTSGEWIDYNEAHS